MASTGNRQRMGFGDRPRSGARQQAPLQIGRRHAHRHPRRVGISGGMAKFADRAREVRGGVFIHILRGSRTGGGAGGEVSFCIIGQLFFLKHCEPIHGSPSGEPPIGVVFEFSGLHRRAARTSDYLPRISKSIEFGAFRFHTVIVDRVFFRFLSVIVIRDGLGGLPHRVVLRFVLLNFDQPVV